MKKMMSASIALLVMEEPHVGPTFVMLILSAAGVALCPLLAAVVVVDEADVVEVVELESALVVDVVVDALAVVDVVDDDPDPLGACAAVTANSAACTFLLTACCCAWDKWFRSD